MAPLNSSFIQDKFIIYSQCDLYLKYFCYSMVFIYYFFIFLNFWIQRIFFKKIKIKLKKIQNNFLTAMTVQIGFAPSSFYFVLDKKKWKKICTGANRFCTVFVLLRFTVQTKKSEKKSAPVQKKVVFFNIFQRCRVFCTKKNFFF